MKTPEEYYKELLSITNLTYPSIKTLSNNYDIKDIIKNIIDSGNEFILKEEYLYCIILKACDSDNFKDELAKILIGFTSKDNNITIDNIIDLYNDIYYFNDIDFYYNNLNKLRDFMYNDQIPLLKEFHELTDAIENKVYLNEYFIIRDIFFIILAYCIVHNKIDNYLEYCYPYIEYPYYILESLFLNGIIMEMVDPIDNTVNYVTNRDALKNYILSRLNQDKKRIIK